MRIYSLKSGNRQTASSLVVRPLAGDGWKVKAEADLTGEVDGSTVRLANPDGQILGSIMITPGLREEVAEMVLKDLEENGGKPAAPVLQEYRGTTGNAKAAGILTTYQTDQWILRVSHLRGMPEDHVQLLDGAKIIGNVSTASLSDLRDLIKSALNQYQVSGSAPRPDPPVAPLRAPDPMPAPVPAPEASPPAAATRDETRELPINLIGHFPGGNQRETFENLAELADSIRSIGILNNLVVNEIDGKYTLIAGERRLRAAGLAGLTAVPCRIKHLSEAEALEAMLVENIQREDLNPMEEAKAYKRLLDIPGNSQVKVAKRVGRSQQHVNEYMQLLDLPAAMQTECKAGRISVRVALDFLRRTRNIPDGIREQVAARVIAQHPTAREAPAIIDRVIEELTGTARAVPPKQTAAAPATPPDTPPAAPTAPTATTHGQAAPAQDAGDRRDPEAPAQQRPPQQTAASAPLAEPAARLASATAAQNRAQGMAAAGLRSWNAWPKRGQQDFDRECYLPIKELLRNWEKREGVAAGNMPHSFGQMGIEVAAGTFWVEAEACSFDQAITLKDGELTIRNDVGGVKLRPDGPIVYYRVELRGARVYEQLVIGTGGQYIVATGEGSVSTAPSTAVMLENLINTLPGMPTAENN